MDCPGATGIAGTYYGVTAQAAFLVGLRFAIVAAENGRTCLIGGGDIIALGAGVTINKIVVSPDYRNL